MSRHVTQFSSARFEDFYRSINISLLHTPPSPNAHFKSEIVLQFDLEHESNEDNQIFGLDEQANKISLEQINETIKRFRGGTSRPRGKAPQANHRPDLDETCAIAKMPVPTNLGASVHSANRLQRWAPMTKISGIRKWRILAKLMVYLALSIISAQNEETVVAFVSVERDVQQILQSRFETLRYQQRTQERKQRKMQSYSVKVYPIQMTFIPTFTLTVGEIQ
ncbi:hypothetical protein ACTXT7_012636 [Hymenolepis weldensis]